MYGIFGKTTLAYTIDREEEGVLKTQPTLPQLTQAAIGVLNQDPDGFFVMIEDGSNDWGGHSRDAAWVGAEIRELDQAVKLAYDWAKEKAAAGQTLIILEADHETGGLIVGPVDEVPADRQADGEHRVDVGSHQGRQDDHREDACHLRRASRRPPRRRRSSCENDEMGISDVLAARYRRDLGLERHR